MQEQGRYYSPPYYIINVFAKNTIDYMLFSKNYLSACAVRQAKNIFKRIKRDLSLPDKSLYLCIPRKFLFAFPGILTGPYLSMLTVLAVLPLQFLYFVKHHIVEYLNISSLHP